MRTSLLILALVIPACVDASKVDLVFCDDSESCDTNIPINFVVCGGELCGGMCGVAWTCETSASGVEVCVVTEPLPGKDDGNLCTADICGPQGWEHIPYVVKDLDDGDPCTLDSCNPDIGIIHTQSCG